MQHSRRFWFIRFQLVVCLLLLLTACATLTPEGEVTLSAQASSTSFEVESLGVASVSRGSSATSSDATCSGGRCAFLSASGSGAQITYSASVPQAGAYTVTIRVKNWDKRGIFQFATAESPSGGFTNRGSPVNQYSASAQFATVNAGTVTFASAGNKGFRFTVTGKDSRSGGYALALDSITLTPAGTTPSSGEWQKLFNGVNLSGWDTYLSGLGKNNDPKGVFKVEDGMLHINDIPATSATQPFGYLVTENTYSNYHLRFQYKWGTKRFAPRATAKRDSGVIYHAGSSDKVWPTGSEIQVQEGDTGDFWLIGGPTLTTTVASTTASPVRYQAGGTPYTTRSGSFVQVAKSQTRDSLTGWNTVELIVQGNEATHIVNGTVVNKGTLKDSSGNPLTRGRILFQAEGAEVYYRNIEIKSLASTLPTTPSSRVVLFNGTSTSAWTPESSGGKLWPINSGTLEVLPGATVGANDLRTRATFGDFKLHLEFNVPASPSGTTEQARGNSGVYLQGRYEVQILDSYGRTLSGANDAGAVYGVRNASQNASRAAGVWQSYDIIFRAAQYSGGKKVKPAYVTVYWNGKRVHYGTAIPRSTTLGAAEGSSRGPIVLQDHGKKVRYRNIWIEPLN